MGVIAQVVIFVCGCLSLFLIARNDRYSKYGFLVGITAQPFWLYTTYVNGQWGIFAVSFIYTANYCLGIWHWFKLGVHWRLWQEKQAN